jgi:MoaA/NifB/PqqE/SkfB family radical SAM enzyme
MIRSRHLKTAFRFLAHRYRALHPYEVQAQLLNTCNTRCVYCACPEVKSPQLTTEQWLSVIRSLGKLGTLRLKFQGGEPTLHEDFGRLCLEAKRAGLISATVSNGFRIVSQPNLLDHLDELVVSLDSTRPEVNNRLRGEGSYPAAIRAIRLAVGRGLRVFVNMAICRENIADLEAMLEFCEALGIRMNAQPVVFGRLYYDAKAQAIGLAHGEIQRLHLQLASWKREGRPLLFSAGSYLRAASWPDTSVLTTRSPGNSPCRAGKSFVHIEPNGDVLPCIQHGADFRPKNVLADGLEEALKHVRQHNCGDCWAAYLNERKTLFALRPAALRELFRRG